jgi:hypothetical protein
MANFEDSEYPNPIAKEIIEALKSAIDYSKNSIPIGEKTKLESFLDIEEKKMEAQLRLLAEDLAKHTLSFKGKLLRRLRDDIDYLILSNCLEKNAYGGELIADEVISTFSANEKDIRLGEYLERIKTMLDFLPSFSQQQISPQTETKTNKLKAPVLGLFCGLTNKIGIDKKDETESATVYCERICSKFKLPYSDRVRQNYNINETKKLIKELTEKVLPLIDNEAKILIQKYLDSKQPPKQNLYA